MSVTDTPSPVRHETAPEDRVPLREKVGLGLGKITADGTHGTLHVLVNPIYNMTLGLNPALISSIVFIQRLWDAMLDPLWGTFSDNFRSRWGRRLPLLASAALPLSLLFAALWWFPRGASQNGLFWHLLLVSLVFYAAHSLYNMPLGGLMLEATDDYHERTRLASVTFAFGWAFQIASQWVFPLTQLAIFSDNITGLRWVVGGCAVAFLISGLAPVFLCRERLYTRVARQPRASLLAGLRAVRDNRAFLAVLSARFILSFGYNLVGMLGIYMNTYYVFGGDLKAAAWAYGFLGSSFHVSAVLSSLFIYPWLTQRLGKKRTLQIAIAVLLVGCSSKLIVYQPGHPWLQFFVLCTNGSASAGFFLLTTAMLGDIADLDEYRTGLRREALYASLLSWFEKAGNSLGSLIAGFVLVWVGFNAKLGGQSAETLALMKYSYFAAPTAGALLALWLVRRYDLTEARAYEIKDALARRRAESAAAPSSA
ncbi:MAG TPA: MFS transporter [Candidatus Didemnitutus sp.]|nr:MFS transporter [Candidatus Didemnitutus sp.]